MSNRVQIFFPNMAYEDLESLNEVFKKNPNKIKKVFENLRLILNSIDHSNVYQVSKLKEHLAELNLSNFWEHVVRYKLQNNLIGINTASMKLLECFIPNPVYEKYLKSVFDEHFLNTIVSSDTRGTNAKENLDTNLGHTSHRVRQGKLISKTQSVNNRKTGRLFNRIDEMNANIETIIAKEAGITELQAKTAVESFKREAIKASQHGTRLETDGFGVFLSRPRKHSKSKSIKKNISKN